MSSVKITNHISEFKQGLTDAVESSLAEIGKEGTTIIQANTPVDTGNLRRNTYHEESENKTSIIADTEYAKVVEFIGRNRRYFRNCKDEIKQLAKNVIGKNIRKVRK